MVFQKQFQTPFFGGGGGSGGGGFINILCKYLNLD